MSASKRRKVDTLSGKPSLSAFAARRALNTKTSSPKRSLGQAVQDKSVLNFNTVSALAGQPSDGIEVHTKIEQESENDTELVEGSASGNLTPLEGDHLSSFHPQSDAPDLSIQRPSITFSTFGPRKENFKELPNGTISLRIAPGERLVVLGQFGLSVQKGQVTLLGAIVYASKKVHRVFASSTHSLPVIRCSATDIDHAEICLHPCESGLSLLTDLSPLYGRLWNDNSGPLGPAHKNLVRDPSPSTFQLLLSSDNGTQKTYMQPLISPPEWNAMLSTCSSTTQQPRVVMICGPKSSGKSTFAKLLVNRLLTTQEERTSQNKTGKTNGVVLLDLDPGQPEYSTPGHLSLIHVQQPNFGTPFSHPIASTGNKSIRSHSIGAISPAMDPSLYMECALDLFAHYRNLLSSFPKCPLVVNTPGWVLGTGLEILVELIQKIAPSEVIYMSQAGPPEVTESLKDAAKSVPLLTLPSQLSEFATRTAAHLRTMQYMSYFHLDGTSKERLSWNGKPLTSMPPWEIRYSGESPGILGILCYGEQPPASLLSDTINGCLVSVVVIDDLSAIPGWSSSNTEDASTAIDSENQEPEDVEHQAFNDEALHLGHIERPLIIRTPDEDLPYFNPANSICLDPKNSHSIGLAMIRGIDTRRKRLQVLTPIDPGILHEIMETGKSIVLICGKLDTPGWAYTEDLLLKTAIEKRGNGDVDMDVEDVEHTGDEAGLVTVLPNSFRNAPWIEKLEGSQGRGIGSRVWRVRRDLGKGGDGE